MYCSANASVGYTVIVYTVIRGLLTVGELGRIVEIGKGRLDRHVIEFRIV